MKKLFHTPEGVRDVYNGECQDKIEIESRLQKVFLNYGYQPIETPTFEYFDVFSKKVGTIPSKDLYKFFDREGNTLVLRPDFTPSIARAASMYFLEEEIPIRLCYKGNTFVNNSSYQGRLKESTQMGVELIGDFTVDADAELLAMMVQALKASGLQEFQVSVGQVDFFKSLIEEAKMSEETVENLRSLISNKNYFGVEELINNLNLNPELEEAFLTLPKLFGTTEILEVAKKLTNNEKAINSINRLERIYEVLTIYGCERYISFDLGMLSKYKYYTGIIFQAYTYGTGEPVAKGGRYNSLLEHFGKKAPAIGFGIVMETLMNALTRQNIKVQIEQNQYMLLYQEEQKVQAINFANEYRTKGLPVQLVMRKLDKSLEDYKKYAKANRVSKLFTIEGDQFLLLENSNPFSQAIQEVENTEKVQEDVK